MSKKDQENQQADENVEIVDDIEILGAEDEAGQDDAEATQESATEQRQKLRDVPDYLTCDEETREIMRPYVEALDPYDLTSIMEFGQEELDRLAAVAREVRERAEREDSLLGAFDEAETQLANIDILSLRDKAAGYGLSGLQYLRKNPGTALATAGTFALVSPFAAVGIPFAKHQLDKAKAKRNGGDLANELRRSVQQTDKTIGSIKAALDKIPATLQDLDELGRSRGHSYIEVSYIIGAGMERLRRIEEEEFPQLEKDMTADPGNPELEMQRDNLTMGYDMLNQRVTDMVASRTVSQATMVTLYRLKSVFAQAAGKLNTHLAVSAPQWEAQMAEANVLMAAHKVTKLSDEADRHGTKVLELSTRLSAQTSKMMADSARKGVYDPQQVVAVLDGITRSIGDEMKKIGSQREDLAQARQLLSDRSQEFSQKMSEFSKRANGQLSLGHSGAANDKLALEDGSKKKVSGGVPPRTPKP